jgi:hypothetical protein
MKYYIGDLAYVMTRSQWKDFCDDKMNHITSHHSTCYGDGSYYDQTGKMYDVDSGTIGVICFNDIADEITSYEGGHIHEFESFPELEYDNGTFIFTDGEKTVRIETNVYDDECGDDYYEDDEYGDDD